MKIVRYLDCTAAINVLNQNGTFCLRSLIYYQNLEKRSNNASIGDKQENKAKFENTKESLESLATVMVSCWSIFNKQKSPDWQLFPEYSKGIAIVSSVDRIKYFLQNCTQHILRDWEFEDKKIKYYKETQKPIGYCNSVFNVPFWKRDIYKVENEYRFAYISPSLNAKLQTLIFYVGNPGDYIDKIYFSPDIDKLKHKKLIGGAIETGMLSKIHNSDQEIKKFKS